MLWRRQQSLLVWLVGVDDMPNELLNVHEEVKRSFRDRIQDNDDISDIVTNAITELTDEEMTNSDTIREVVEEVITDENS